ncbi:MAG: thioredoxin family protein [Alphaproteobacteria bacterium]
MTHNVVSPEEWLTARKALLAKERDVTHQLDALREERRRLPWVRVEKPYRFIATRGPVTLDDLFAGRSQLAVYHFMLAPGSDHVCDGCAFIADHVDAARQHFEHAGLSFAAISRAPIEQIEPVRTRFGWRFAWVSSHGSDFNHDFGVSFTEEQVASGSTGYNYGTTAYAHADLPGASIFAKDEAGRIHHTYSTYTRRLELLDGAFNWLDLVPKGRNEGDDIMSWVRLHDEYDGAEPAEGRCHAG